MIRPISGAVNPNWLEKTGTSPKKAPIVAPLSPVATRPKGDVRQRFFSEGGVLCSSAGAVARLSAMGASARDMDRETTTKRT